MPAKLLKISYPVPSDKNGHEFSSAEQLLSLLGSENSGQYLVGSQGMWHGGIHITDATVPWCALSADTAAEREYLAKNAPYKGGQFIRCMAEGKIVAWRVCKDYDSAAIAWRDGHVFQSTSFVLVEHYIQPGEKDSSGLTFHTLYMNMAPFEAYITEEGANQRKVAKSQRYYASKEDVLASPAKPAGTLPGGTAVTLSDNLITRGSDRRQFTQVTLSAEAKNTAGKKLAAGTPVWTVSDRGSLLAASSAVPVPSWWTKCSPAYGNQTSAGVQCTARTNWQFYLSSDDVLKGNNAGSLTAGFPLTYEPDNAGQQMTRPAKNKNEAARIFSLVTLGRNVGKMKKGDRVWVVSDGDSLTKMAQAAAGGEPKFGEVVIPATPVEINAGDSIGHMGFYELPEEDGKQSRYQVHIECLSMDSKLPTFLTNPDKVGGDSPTFLKYPEGANLFAGNAEGAMVDTKRVTRAPGILTLSGVPVIRADEVVTHYQIHPEGGWLPAANIIKLPQWALGDLGFVTLDRKPESFDLIDGKKQPNNVVKGILAEMYKAAKADPRTGSALYHYNYDRLLKQIDRNNDGQFSEEEYIQAIRLPAYRDHLYRIIAKHPSEWWYGKDDALWKKYLYTLAKDAPSWKTYLETFIDRLTWMKSVAGMGPDPWHMHPVVFLSNLKGTSCNCEELYADQFKVTKYGTQYGPVYWGSITLDSYSRWDELILEGKITSNEKSILIAMSENEGKMDAIQSYDSEVITAGAMQKTVKDQAGLKGKGELPTQLAKFRDDYPGLYDKYAKPCGWTVEGSGSSAVIYYSDNVLTQGVKVTSSELKTLVRQGCTEDMNKKVVHNKPLAALLKVISLPEYLDIQVMDFIERLHIAEDQVVIASTNKKIKDFVKSDFGRALILDHSVNRPSFVVPDFKKAVDNFYAHNPNVSSDPGMWGAESFSHETKLLEEYKLTRRMTSSSLRFNSLKAKL